MTKSEPTIKQRAAIENGTYDVPDIAAMLKCSERHIRRMIDAREIPGMIRLGRLVRFHKRLVDEWLAGKVKG